MHCVKIRNALRKMWHLLCAFPPGFENTVTNMKMKSFVSALAVVASLMSLCSCEKEGVKLFDGNYSFKTSGILTVERIAEISETDGDETASGQASDNGNSEWPGIDLPDIDLPDIPGVVLPDGDRTFRLPLTSESGQMNIIKTGDNSAIVTMNIVGGDALVFNGKAEGKTLTLDPAVRFVHFRDGASTVQLEVPVSGTAEKHDDVAIFKLEYVGKGETTLYDYEIKDSDVKCVAKVNED